MTLLDLIHRTASPAPWAEGDNIPWHDPAFSERMLREHLSQDHDAASRRAAIIDRHVQWIHDHLLQQQPARILDLGCGPGFYANRLAALGHTCTGIDYSPASVAYAQQQAAAQQLTSTFIHADIRHADYGSGCDLVMLVFGEFNIFKPQDARQILRKAHAALKPGGTLLLEPHHDAYIRQMGQQPNTWYTAESGLFSEQPHLVLEEYTWDEACRAATTRHFIVDARTGTLTRHASSMQAYTDDEYRALLAECGFDSAAFYPSLSGQQDIHPALQAISARRTPA